ncbi:MAG: PD-(D/E)XK nuclease family protein [Candidatus Omnitrophota bacterium]|nr:PD-(D/E)XK nuclease family protein [Candidatus Omnitrophota bacterium]
MERVITFDLKEDFIDKLAGFIDSNFIKKGADLSRLAFVFEGKRPGLFLNRALAKRAKNSFYPPVFFSIDRFIDYTLSKKAPFAKMPGMESCYLIYTLAKRIAPEVLKNREKFSQFLPWAREISNFINSLDTEDIPSDNLRNIEANADIGYDIPDNINTFLKNIIELRKAYHKELSEKNSFPRGYAYLSASNAVGKVSFDEFDRIFFCGFFYIQKTERRIIKHLCDTGKASLIFQGDGNNWPVLKSMSQELSCPINPAGKKKDACFLNLHAAFDRHSQVCAVREILKGIREPGSTVVVLPDAASMIPLVSEIGSLAGEFNVSIGYPLRRSSLYSLFEFITQAQRGRKSGEYYAKNYLAALSQPLVKNLKILPSFSATRVVVHKIEEALLGAERTPLSGRLFIRLEEVENDEKIFKSASRTLKNMDIEASPLELQNVIRELHSLLFICWEKAGNFGDFAVSLGNLLDALVEKSAIRNYGLNLKIAERMYLVKDELLNAPFSKEDFTKEEVFKIFRNMIEGEMTAFAGSPLKGLQILGILETRSLNFKNVIMMDANESILPRLRMQRPLIPHDVALGAGLEIIGREEEIQRYQFRRIISAAENVHLVYEENFRKEKSRFIEDLLWQIEKDKKAFDVTPIPQMSFSVNVMPAGIGVKKTGKMIEFLENHRYSATSLDKYIHCPLRFYYKYVLGLKEKEELADGPEGVEIGRFIHELLENTFERFINKKPQIDEEFRGEFFAEFDRRFKQFFGKRIRSGSFLLENVMRFRLERFLDFEKNDPNRQVEEIICLEDKFQEKIEFSGHAFDFTYIMDRVDRLKDGSILILDYKTGTRALKPQKAAKLEGLELNRESIRDGIKSFQLPLYYYFEKKKRKKEILNAALYGLRNLKLAYLFEEKADIEKSMDIYMKALDFILHEIVNPKKPFTADRENENNCRHCPFFYLCR